MTQSPITQLHAHDHGSAEEAPAHMESAPKHTASAPITPWLNHYPRDIAWDQALVAEPLPGLLDRAVAKFGPRPCTQFVGKTLTYAEMGNLVNRAAKGLQALGIGKGKKVGLLLPNTPTAIIFYYGTLKAGGTVVNFNPLYTLEELSNQVKDSGTEIMVTLDLRLLFDKAEAMLASGVLPRAIIAPFPELLPAVKGTLFKIARGKELAKIARSAQAAKIIPQASVLANDGRPAAVAIDPVRDVAVLQYTGGTTGIPKGAMLSHANLGANIQQMLAWAPGLEPGKERVMGILPFFHVFAMTTVMNFGLASGAELVLMPKFELNEALKLINATKPTIMPGVPTLYNAMMNHPQLPDFDLSSLKFCISGGAPLPIEVKRGFEALSGCKLVEGYGLSESSPVATCNPVLGAVKEGSIGQPVPQTIISIRSMDDPTIEMPLGDRGEICIKGPQVMLGYYNRPAETANVMVGDFLRTGDVGYMDEDGFTFIVDRMKDLILCSGYNVYPRQIEEAIYRHPAVEEVTVIGIPDRYRGESPKAFIKLKEGQTITPEQMLEFLADKLSKIEMPSQIEFRKELPKTMVGKLSKKELRQEALAERM